MKRKIIVATVLCIIVATSAMAFNRNNAPYSKETAPFFETCPLVTSDITHRAPMTEISEGFESDTLAGWVFYDEDGNGYHWFQFNAPSMAHGGDRFMGTYYDTTSTPPLANDDWMVSPPITVDDTSYVLSFWIASQETHFEWFESYQLWISTTDNEVASFTDSIDGQINIPSSWTMKQFSLADYVGETIYIGWRCTSHDDFILKIDDVHVGGALAYAMGIDPTYAYGVLASGSTANYKVTITNSGSEDDEYGLTFSSFGSWVFDIVDSMGTSMTITPVVPAGESYDFFVEVEVPVVTDSTIDSFTVEVTSIGDPSGTLTQDVSLYPTAVPATSIPYTTGMDTDAELAGWLLGNTGTGLYDWFLIDTSYVDPAYISSMPYSGVAWQDSSDQDIWLISPLIDLTGVSSAHLTFEQLGLYGLTNYEYHGIWASYTNASPRWLEHEWFEVEDLGMALENDYETKTVSLDDLTGNYVYLAFRYQGYWADIWFVDDIEIGPGAAVENQPELARDFRLTGNSPNPFNPATTIHTNVPGEGVIEIFDINGRCVRNLPVEGTSTLWDGRTAEGEEVPCGIYLYRLSGTDDVRRMVLLK